MVKRDLADTLKYEGYIIRHDNVFDEGRVTWQWVSSQRVASRQRRSWSALGRCAFLYVINVMVRL
jgi:hypothetical protein